jgi:hypothetical protein
MVLPLPRTTPSEKRSSVLLPQPQSLSTQTPATSKLKLRSRLTVQASPEEAILLHRPSPCKLISPLTLPGTLLLCAFSSGLNFTFCFLNKQSCTT